MSRLTSCQIFYLFICFNFSTVPTLWWCLRAVVVKDYDCVTVIFVRCDQWRHYVSFSFNNVAFSNVTSDFLYGRAYTMVGRRLSGNCCVSMQFPLHWAYCIVMQSCSCWICYYLESASCIQFPRFVALAHGLIKYQMTKTMICSAVKKCQMFNFAEIMTPISTWKWLGNTDNMPQKRLPLFTTFPPINDIHFLSMYML